LAEIKEKLLNLSVLGTGEKVFRSVYTRDDFKGAAQADAPDLQLAYNEGFQTAKASARGGAPRAMFEPNDDKWSGEHAASDVADTPGIFFANRTFDISAVPAIVDLGPTALAYMGLRLPEGLDGKPLTRAK
jgi:predicted AlkP superfamily phosphohydrolase/phosphomutase